MCDKKEKEIFTKISSLWNEDIRKLRKKRKRRKLKTILSQIFKKSSQRSNTLA